MMHRSWMLALACAVSCGYPTLAPLQGDAADAAAGALIVSAQPAQINLRVNETRATKLVVTNPTAVTSGPPSLAVTGFNVGTVVFDANTCTTGLAPGATCSALGQLTATTSGAVDVQVTAAAGLVEPGSVTLTVTAREACVATCGPSGVESCCASSMVPGNGAGASAEGDAFYRGYDVATDTAYKDMGAPATISDFRLDTYEVSVGRFREFVAAGYGTQNKPPTNGAGAHPHLTGSGWDPTWSSSLSASTASLANSLKCNTQFQTWTDAPGTGESRPINCLTWYEAMAFCIWDAGYLPSEAEWDYAAVGGASQRAYPWSAPASSTSASCTQANYGGANFPTSACVAPGTGGTNRVGSESPAGDGRWNHADLAGNVAEWVLDANAPYVTPCADCANLTTQGMRSIRGGSFLNPAAGLRANLRSGLAPNGRNYTYGVRCARLP